MQSLHQRQAEAFRQEGLSSRGVWDRGLRRHRKKGGETRGKSRQERWGGGEGGKSEDKEQQEEQKGADKGREERSKREHPSSQKRTLLISSRPVEALQNPISDVRGEVIGKE